MPASPANAKVSTMCKLDVQHTTTSTFPTARSFDQLQMHASSHHRCVTFYELPARDDIHPHPFCRSFRMHSSNQHRRNGLNDVPAHEALHPPHRPFVRPLRTHGSDQHRREGFYDVPAWRSPSPPPTDHLGNEARLTQHAGKAVDFAQREGSASGDCNGSRAVRTDSGGTVHSTPTSSRLGHDSPQQLFPRTRRSLLAAAPPGPLYISSCHCQLTEHPQPWSGKPLGEAVT